MRSFHSFSQRGRLLLVRATVLGLITAISAWCTAQPAENQLKHGATSATELPGKKPPGSRFALGVKASTLGLGADAGIRLARFLNLRAGFNTFNYSRTLSSDGLAYDSTFHLRSVQALADWFPFHHDFHVSGGLLVYNGNRVTAGAVVPNNQVLNVGNENIVSNPANPITARADSNVRTYSPIVALGFGNFVPRGRRFGFSVDLGVVFQGQPRSSFMFRGSACDPGGDFCGDIASDQNAQAQALSETRIINKDMFFMRYYPFVSLEFSYHF